jgi:hypothetical protein
MQLRDSEQLRDTTMGIGLGSYFDMSCRCQCRSCQDICEALELSSFSKYLPKADDTTEIRYHLIGTPDALSFSVGSGQASQRLDLHPVNPSIFETTKLSRRHFDPRQFNLDLARQWISHCDRYHGDKCQWLPSDLVPIPLKLIMIDLQDGCLVETSADVKYVTLSYVWGQVAVLKTTRDNKAMLHQRGSLLPDAKQYNIPETIRDAMRLTQSLGLRYLWIDALCIVQDDEDSKKQYLNAMASIYAQSYLTIVAAEGEDASWGLRGTGGHSRPRDLRWPIINFPGKPMMIRMGEAEIGDLSKWNMRGWTFQEKAFARRMLVFNGIVTWNCATCHWSEDTISPDYREPGGPLQPRQTQQPRGLPRFHSGEVKPGSWPRVGDYFNTVNTFNQRELTFSKDVFDAFAGVSAVMGQQFRGGFHFGLPQLFFDAALLWQPGEDGPLKRRVSETTGDILRDLPSWSWVGWKGTFNWHLVNDSAVYVQQSSRSLGPNITLESICEWFAVGGIARRKVQIGNTMSMYRDSHTEYSDGWSQHENSTENFFCNPPAARSRLNGGYWDQDENSLAPYWTHPKFQYLGGSPVRFLYPIPIGIGTPQELAGPYLLFKARRARLTISLPPQISRANLRGPTVFCSLRDDQGGWAGILCLNDSAERQVGETPWGFTTYYRARPKQIPSGTKCELIAISRAKVRNEDNWWTDTYFPPTLEEWTFDERPKDTEFYEFYNVLWIERSNGIAYRKALGRVIRETWERMQSELIDVILG